MTTTEKRKVLGRGLETLLPSRHAPQAPATTATPPPGRAEGDGVLQVSLQQLDRNPYQTRTSSLDATALDELAASIKAVGVMQPIVVRPVGGARYQVIAGERRCAASRLAGLSAIPAIVRQVSNEQAMEMTIIENLQREDLNPMEQARAFDRLGRDFGLTHEQMSLRTGKERSSISNYLRLLKLPPSVQSLVETEQLSLGHAKCIMALEAAELERLAKRIVDEGLSVRRTEEAVAALLHPHPKEQPKQREVDPNVREAENMLQRALGVRVLIDDRKGKGKILIEYHTLEDFDRIVAALKGD